MAEEIHRGIRMTQDEYKELNAQFGMLMIQVLQTQKLFTKLGTRLDAIGEFEKNASIFYEQVVLLQALADSSRKMSDILSRINPDGLFWDPQ